MVRKLVAVLFAITLVGASVSAAQVSIGAAGQWFSPSSDDYKNNLDIKLNSGFGAAGSIMYAVTPAISLGGSVQWSSHGLEEASTGTAAANNASILGLFGEGRYSFTTASKATPYIGARVGWAQWTYSEAGDDLKANGLAFGGGVGVMIGLTPTLSLDLNGMFNSHSFGDIKVNGTSASGTDGNVTGIQIRAGVSYKLGTQ
jgi:opacity protein-like surface antigen